MLCSSFIVIRFVFGGCLFGAPNSFLKSTRTSWNSCWRFNGYLNVIILTARHRWNKSTRYDELTRKRRDADRINRISDLWEPKLSASETAVSMQSVRVLFGENEKAKILFIYSYASIEKTFIIIVKSVCWIKHDSSRSRIHLFECGRIGNRLTNTRMWMWTFF